MSGCINEHNNRIFCNHGNYKNSCGFCEIDIKLNSLDNKIENLRILVNSLDNHRFNTVASQTKLTKQINELDAKVTDNYGYLEKRIIQLECETDKNASPHFDHDDYRDLKQMISKLQDNLRKCK